MTDNLIDLKIKSEFFNTKFLFYNYYQFNKQNKIPINYRTPYCILDGIYLDIIELKINKIIKKKYSNKFNIQFILYKNNNTLPLLNTIDEFNKIFFKNIKLNNNYKKKRTLKNSSSNSLQNKIYYNNIDNLDNQNDVFDTNQNDVFNYLNYQKPDIKYERENNRFNNLDNFINKNKYYQYKNFIINDKDNENYLIECEIKPEYCQKLFYKLRTNFNFSNLSNSNLSNSNLSNSNLNNNKDVLTNRIFICNDIIKFGNVEYFKFNNSEKIWDCNEWNILLNVNIKSNNFDINNNGDLEMIWKIGNFTL